ncbi:MAG: DNA translocase FtsK 4TM domain-containing protein [Sphingobacteriales bacterium]|nr:MAG: DNA translocase FtsK 4TM domain-containing protein [Sphingobacteriales bacterium]
MATKKTTSTTSKKTTTGNTGTSGSRKTSTSSVALRKLRINIVKFLKTEGFQKATGFFFWLMAAFLGIALISFIVKSWGSDYSYVQNIGFLDTVFDAEVHTENWLGRLGSYLSHLFFYRLFGLSSFILVGVLFMTGRKLIYNLQQYSLAKLYRNSFILLVLGSTLLSFLFSYFTFPFGGWLGNYFSQWLTSFMGFPGTFFFLVFCVALVLIFMFKLSIQVPAFTGFSAKFPWLQKLSAVFNTSAPSNLKERRRRNLQESISDEEEDNDLMDEDEEVAEFERGKQIQLDFDQQLQARINRKKKLPPPNPGELLIETVPPDRAETDIEKEDHTTETETEEYDPTLELSKYTKPEIDLLDKYGRDLHPVEMLAVSREELERNKEQIIETLLNYNIEITSIVATPGPTVTLYEIVPAPGVRISRIRNLEDDIALSLAALGIRIIAPMPGKGTIGIEVPNQNKETVSLRSLIASEKFQQTKMVLPIALGKTISDENFIADLSKMPHLLLAGSTGQGKSVCLNSILISLVYKKHPAELKFVMIDPKKVELSLYNVIEKHFLAKLPGSDEPIITDTQKVIHTLNALCIEMDERYNLLKKAYVRNIAEYNRKFKQRKLNPEKGHRFLPYIVLVIDEFADLIMTAGKEVEMPLARLAQLSRAVGLHLVIATQRPTVNIITGTIKANFPVRVAFRVTAKVDSRTILDQGGANQLIGSGDMLLSIGGDIIRLQGAFVDTHEVERVAEFIGEQQGYADAFLLPEYRDEDETLGSNSSNMEFDDMFDEAAYVVVQHQQGSTSLIQRRLKLGYNRAGRIMDQLEAAGIVGPNAGSKAREVLVSDLYELDNLLQHLQAEKKRV